MHILPLSVLDHFDCYFLEIFLTLNLFFFHICRLQDFLNFSEQQRNESKKNSYLGMYTHPNGDALEWLMECSSQYFVSFKVVYGCFQQCGFSVWFLRHNDLEYV